jgi:hypothetical protein
VALCVVYVLNVPFYAGSRIGSIGSWRLEHGRMGLRWGTRSTESFYVAINSEGLRFRPEARLYSATSGEAHVPLWMPILLVAGVTGWAWARAGRQAPPAGVCAGCGYSLRSLPAGAPCPECGRADHAGG